MTKRLSKFLIQEAERRGYTLGELSERIGLHQNQLYQLRSRQAGLQICLKIARYTQQPIGLILYLAGHVTEGEFRGTSSVPPEIFPLLDILQTMRAEGDPMFEPTLRLLRQAIDTIQYARDLPDD